MKRTSKVQQRFVIAEQVKSRAEAYTKNVYQTYFENWIKPWPKCILSYSDYFEEDQINIDAWTHVF